MVKGAWTKEEDEKVGGTCSLAVQGTSDGMKYIYSSTVVKYNFDVLVLYSSIPIFCKVVLPLHYILEANIVTLYSTYLMTLVTL